MITDKLIEVFADDSIEKVELICCDKAGPCLSTEDKLVNVNGYIDKDDNSRYSRIELIFEHFTWTFHHKFPIDGIRCVSENEFLLNPTNPWICGQFLIRVYRGDKNGSPSQDRL